MNDGFGYWLAGFIDGEGHFAIIHRAGGTTYTPSFCLALRDDDGEILYEIVRRTGLGRVYGTPQVNRSDGANRAPRLDWRISNKTDLAALVVLLDRYPLRARKADDYAIWREAVLLWTTRKGHRGAAGRTPHPIQARLATAKVELEAVRRYSTSAPAGTSTSLAGSLRRSAVLRLGRPIARL